MILSMVSQVKLFLMTILIGISAGFVYDLIKSMRKIIRHNNFVIQLEDFIYWITISVAMFFIMLSKNSGQVRGFCIGGALFGMLLYSLTLSKFVVNICVSTINFIMKIVINTIRIILYPIRILLNIIEVPWNFVKIRFIKIAKAIKKYLYISNRYAKIKSKGTLNNLKIIFKKI